MPLTTSNSAPFLTQDQIGDLLVRPVMDTSVASRVCTSVTTTSHTYRVPIITADPSAAWVPEGVEIPFSQTEGDELPITPQSVKGLTSFSVEFEGDATPEVIAQVGDGLTRDIARRVDHAFFADSGQANQPAGLADLTGFNPVDSGGWTDADPFSLAVVNAETHFTQIDSWVCNPATLGQLMSIKEGTTSVRPLLTEVVVANQLQRQIMGAQVLVSPYVPDGVVWGLPRNRCVFVVREDASVTRHDDTLASSGQVLLRGLMRIGWGFTDPAALSKIAAA